MKKIFLFLSSGLISIFGYGQISSDFSTNADGWTTPGAFSGVLNYNASGGNPGGFVSASDPFSAGPPIYWYYQAPAKFLGNLSTYYNGTLSFDLAQASATVAAQRADVILSTGTTSLYYFNLSPATPAIFPAWTSYKIALNEITGNWKTSNSSTGTPATQSDIQFALGNLISVQIRGRFGSIQSSSTLDNVLFQPFVVTTQPISVGVCEGATATLTAIATGNSSISYQWQKLAPIIVAVVYNNVVDGGGYSGATTSTLSINTTGGFGVGTYRCLISGVGANNIVSFSVGVGVNSNPASPSATGNSACGSSAITLNASGGTNGQYRWYSAATGGTAIAGQVNGTYTTSLLGATTTYYVSINNGTCESTRTPVIATINTIPTSPTAAGNSSCGSSAIALNASGGINGQYRWYTVASGGTAISGEVNASFTTPVLLATTNYYVSINNGTCESTRTLVTATINTIPIAPTPTGSQFCSGFSAILNASGGVNGQYKWYTVSTGGTALVGEVNSTYATPALTATTTYYVTLTSSGCESLRTPVVATLNTACNPPVITSKPLATIIGGKISLNLVPLIKTVNNNLDLKSLQIITSPTSGGKASIDAAGILTIDYTGLKFSGKENIMIKACDLNNNCTQQAFSIEVAGAVVVYNAVSPNGDDKNPIFRLEFIDTISPKNQVMIYNRWGDEVFSISDYDNNKRVFAGLTNEGSKLPTGTYYYKVNLLTVGKILTGYLELRY